MAYQRITLADLRDQAADRFEEVPFYDTEDLDRAINEALRLWNAITGYWRVRITAVSAPSDPLLPIPGTLVQRTQITYQGRTFGPPVSLEELSKLQPNWWLERTDSGGAVPTRPTLWAPIGLSLVAIWPAPASGNAHFDVDGIRQTPVLTDPADFVDIGDEEISILLGYAIHAASVKAGAVFVERTKKYRLQFLAAAALRNGRMLSQQWYRKFQRESWQKAIRPQATPDPEAMEQPR